MRNIEVLDGITDKQEIWCRTYAKTLSYREATEAAGFSESHDKVGYRLMKRDSVRNRVRELIKAGATDAEYDVTEVIRYLKNAAFLDVTDFFEEASVIDFKGERFTTLQVKDFQKLEKWQRMLITEIYTTKAGSIRVKFFSKEKAIELLGRYYNIFGAEVSDLGSTPNLIINFTKVENKQLCEK